MSERRACRVVGQARSTQRRLKKVRKDEEALREDVVKLARRFGRYGYRRVTGMLKAEGWRVNHKRVERIWRQEGLNPPKRLLQLLSLFIYPLRGLPSDEAKANNPGNSDGTSTAVPTSRICH